MGTWISTQQSWMQKARGAAGTQPELALGQRGVQGPAAPQGWARLKQGTAKPRANLRAQLLLVNKLARGKAREADALPGPDLRCHQPHTCSCPRGRTGRSNRRLVLSLSGFPSSQRLELKNSIFPFSGASAPARGLEQSREAPTLPAAPAAAKDALTALARTGQHTGGTDLPAHAMFTRPWRCWQLHMTSLLCTNPV